MHLWILAKAVLFTSNSTLATLRRPNGTMPIMDDGMTNLKTYRITSKPILACCFILLLSQLGCQPQSGTGGLFGFGNRSTFNTNSPISAFNRSSFNNPFGGLASKASSGAAGITDAFQPSSPFGQFAQSSGSFRLPTNPNVAARAQNLLGQGTGQFGQANQLGQVGQFGQPGLAQEFDRIQGQIGAYDADNQLLNTEVATLNQKLQLANQYNQTLKQQLADTADRASRSDNQQLIDQQQFASLQQQIQSQQQRISEQERLLAQGATDLQNLRRQQAESRTLQSNFQRDSSPFQNSGFSSSGGSATIRANNGLMQKLDSINIPGGDARMDGDIIRIEFPTDRLFVSGQYRIQAAQLPVLQNIASTIRQSFPRQIIGVEAHWDGTPLNPPGTTDHQLTATQALSVVDELVRLGLPSRQLFAMAMASNRPRHQQRQVAGVSPNRRIELVIYPETYDSR